MFKSDRPEATKHLPLSNDGSLLSWGGGEFGQHGHGRMADVAISEAEVEFFNQAGCKVKGIACGASHSAIVTENNEIFAWGNGNSGQLGNDDRKNHGTPQRIRFEVLLEPTIRMVDCGGRHTMIVTESGRVFTCGNNFSAQLGYDFRADDYKRNQYTPRLMRSLQHCKVSHVSCGSRHTLFLLCNGAVASCGSNSFGQLGLGDKADAVVPQNIDDLPSMWDVACGSSHSVGIDERGHVYAWGYSKALGRSKDQLKPIRIPVPRRVRSIACGSNHSVLLSGSGFVFTFGMGADGQLGHGTEVSRLSVPEAILENAFSGAVAQISAGENFSVALTPCGDLYMWGKNTNKVMFDQPESRREWAPCCIDTEGRKIAKIKCGAWHVLAITGQPEWEAVEDSDVTDVESDAGLTSDSEQFTGTKTNPESSEEEQRVSNSLPIIKSHSEEQPPPLTLPPVPKAKKPTIDEVRPESRDNHSRCSCRRSMSPIVVASPSKATIKLARRPVPKITAKPAQPARPLLRTPNIQLTLSSQVLTGSKSLLSTKRNAAAFSIYRSRLNSDMSSSSTPNLVQTTPTRRNDPLRPLTSDSAQRKKFGASPPRRRGSPQKVFGLRPKPTAAWQSKSVALRKPNQLKSVLTASGTPSLTTRLL